MHNIYNQDFVNGTYQRSVINVADKFYSNMGEVYVVDNKGAIVNVYSDISYIDDLFHKLIERCI